MNTQKRLGAREEAELFRHAKKGDEDARDRLVRSYLPLAYSLAGRYRHTSEENEDLRQVASLALVKAVDRFDQTRGLAFSAFAVPTILGELKRHFRDHAWSVRVPRELQERRGRVSVVIDRLTGDLGHAPTVSEISAALGITIEDVLEAIRVGDAYDSVSLDQPRSTDSEVASLNETLGSNEEGYELAEYSVASERTMKELSERDRAIFRMRFFQDKTQTEIAEEIGISQMQVSRILSRAVESLREAADEDLEKETPNG